MRKQNQKPSKANAAKATSLLSILAIITEMTRQVNVNISNGTLGSVGAGLSKAKQSDQLANA